MNILIHFCLSNLNKIEYNLIPGNVSMVIADIVNQ